MARQSKKIGLKDGYYIEIKSNVANHQSPILVRRGTKEEIDIALKQYSKTKNARYYGEIKNQKIVVNK